MDDANKISIPEAETLVSSWPHMPEGSIIGAAVLEAVRECQTSHALATMCALGAISTACQGHIDVELPTGYVVPSSLMLLTIADSGERKTATHDHFFRYLIDRNFIEIQKAADQHESYEKDLSFWKEQEKALNQSIRKAAASPEELDELKEKHDLLHAQKPKKPISKRFLYDDITPHSLLHGLANNSNNGCLTSSEGGSIFSSRAASDLAKFNSLWDGSITSIDRLDRESINIKDARLTISSLIQPRVLDDFIARKESLARGSGFFARLIIAKPESISGNRKARIMSKEMPRIMNFQNRIKEIFESQRENNTKKIHVTFTEEAKNYWFECSAEIERQMSFPELYHSDKDHANKLIDNASRVAACLQTFEQGLSSTIEITLETMMYSWNFVKRASRCFLDEVSSEPEISIVTNLLAKYLLNEAYKISLTNKNPEIYPRLGVNISLKIYEIKQQASTRLRGKKNSDLFEKAIILLSKLGHVKKTGGSIYFSESILLEAGEPELKNGEQYYIRCLPRFCDQARHRPTTKTTDRRERYSDILEYYIMRPSSY